MRDGVTVSCMKLFSVASCHCQVSYLVSKWLLVAFLTRQATNVCCLPPLHIDIVE